MRENYLEEQRLGGVLFKGLSSTAIEDEQESFRRGEGFVDHVLGLKDLCEKFQG